MLSKGATTWWERWNGDTGDPAMNSYNHYAFGSVVAWAYRDIAGINTTLVGPGFREIVIRPRLDSAMNHAHGEYDSVYGKIVTDWSGTPSEPFLLKVTIPANTLAKVYLPATPNVQITSVLAQQESGTSALQVGSGSYEFQVK